MKIKFLLILTLSVIVSCTSSGRDDSPPVVNEDDTNEMEMMMEVVDLYEGDFISVAHPTSGKAIVNEEHTNISFKNFKTDDGPLLEVYLATDTSASNYITLGVLQGIEGDFDYTLPENVDFDTYKFVIIWCVDFSVNFGHAILE